MTGNLKLLLVTSWFLPTAIGNRRVKVPRENAAGKSQLWTQCVRNYVGVGVGKQTVR